MNKRWVERVIKKNNEEKKKGKQQKKAKMGGRPAKTNLQQSRILVRCAFGVFFGLRSL